MHFGRELAPYDAQNTARDSSAVDRQLEMVITRHRHSDRREFDDPIRPRISVVPLCLDVEFWCTGRAPPLTLRRRDGQGQAVRSFTRKVEAEPESHDQPWKADGQRWHRHPAIGPVDAQRSVTLQSTFADAEYLSGNRSAHCSARSDTHPGAAKMESTGQKKTRIPARSIHEQGHLQSSSPHIRAWWAPPRARALAMYGSRGSSTGLDAAAPSPTPRRRYEIQVGVFAKRYTRHGVTKYHPIQPCPFNPAMDLPHSAWITKGAGHTMSWTRATGPCS